MPKTETALPLTADDSPLVHDFDMDLRDLAEARTRDAIRALVFDLPERPGTRRG